MGRSNPLPEYPPPTSRIFLCDAQAFPSSLFPITRCLAGVAAVGRHGFDGALRFPEKRNMFSIVVGFGVGTLFATVLLLLMQMLEDFRDS